MVPRMIRMIFLAIVISGIHQTNEFRPDKLCRLVNRDARPGAENVVGVAVACHHGVMDLDLYRVQIASGDMELVQENPEFAGFVTDADLAAGNIADTAVDQHVAVGAPGSGAPRLGGEGPSEPCHGPPLLVAEVEDGRVGSGGPRRVAQLEHRPRPQGVDHFEKLAAIQNEIDITNPEMTAYYGVGVQKNVASFADEIMKHVKNKDTGHVGEMLVELMQAIKSVDVARFKDEKPGLLTRLFRGIHSGFGKLVLRYERISGQLDRLVDNLSETTHELVQDMHTLDGLFQRNLEHFEGLNLYIIAGEKKIEEDFRKTIEDLERAANESGEHQKSAGYFYIVI